MLSNNDFLACLVGYAVAIYVLLFDGSPAHLQVLLMIGIVVLATGYFVNKIESIYEINKSAKSKHDTL